MTPAAFAAARKTLSLTQKQLGEAFGVTMRQVQNWESKGPSVLASRYMAALLSGYRPDDVQGVMG